MTTTTDKLEDVWATRDFPVLRELTRRIDAGERPVRLYDLPDAVGLDLGAIGLAVDALERREYIQVGRTLGGPRGWHVNDVAGTAYLLTGLHPDGDDTVSRLVSALRQAADQQPDDEQRGKLRQAADAVGGVARDVIGGVLTAVLTRAAGV